MSEFKMERFATPYSAGVSIGKNEKKTLQNYVLSDLDLLVRESIQNSSDASIESSSNRPVQVNFTIGEFKKDDFASLFDEVEGNAISEYFFDEKHSFVEVRDSETTGLTGDTRIEHITNQVQNNFLNLVFYKGNEQTKVNAGGSWGYGKSIYYRVGEGIVIYYSQIEKEEGGYEQRLIFVLVEDTLQERSLLKKMAPGQNLTGLAWWGVNKNDFQVFPITDPNWIEKILKVFGLKPFKEGKTGTSVIIPFFKEKELMNKVKQQQKDWNEKDRLFFEDIKSVKDYLKISVQRWYAPRISNKVLGRKSLRVSVRDLKVSEKAETLIPKDMEAVFQIIQDLYTHALCKNNGEEIPTPLTENLGLIHSIEIPSMSIEGNKAGHVAYISVNKNDLNSAVSPYIYLGCKNGLVSENDPIGMFTRSPGMILDYKVNDEWVHRLNKSDNEDYIQMYLFLPRVSAKLKMEGEYDGKEFEIYLRACEKSDHMNWDDHAGYNLIKRIRKHIVNKLNDKNKEKNAVKDGAEQPRLAVSVGREFLKTVVKKKKDSKTRALSTRTSTFRVNDVSFSKDEIKIYFDLKFKNGGDTARIIPQVSMERGTIDSKEWSSIFEKEFPFTIRSIEAIKVENINQALDLNKDTSAGEITGMLDASMDLHEGLRIRMQEKDKSVSGVFCIKTADRTYTCDFKVLSWASEEE